MRAAYSLTADPAGPVTADEVWDFCAHGIVSGD
jgi:hypothetical protein